MRSGLIIAGGVACWAVCMAVARITVGLNARTASMVTATFAGLWFLAAAANMWVGVSRAGYALREELPIFLLIFAVPVLGAVFVKWRWWS